MDWLTKLNLKGYKYNPDQTDNANGIYYDSVDSVDDWIEIVRDANFPNGTLIILTVKNSMTQKIESYTISGNWAEEDNIWNLENWINH